MKTTTLLIFAILNIWFASASPLPPRKLASVLNEDAVIEFFSKLSQEVDRAEVSEESGVKWPDQVDPPSFEKPASTLNENAVIELLSKLSQEVDRAEVSEESGVKWPDKVDPPSFEKPGSMQSSNEGAPKKDEERINEENGISKQPNVIGDLVLSPEQRQKLVNGGSATSQATVAGAILWPNAVIPYVIDVNFNPIAANVIQAAMNELMLGSCLKFVPLTPFNFQLYPNYVHFFPGQGCYSGLGMVGGAQIISIGAGCVEKPIVQHEILHALGRIHEQSRMDRDQYVNVFLNNVQQDQKHNFDKLLSNANFIPYDYGSIMHYAPDAFSIRPGDPRFYTVTPKAPGVYIGQRQGLSLYDWEHIKRVYCPSPFNSEIQSAHQNDA